MRSFQRKINVHPITKTELWPPEDTECLVWDGGQGTWVLGQVGKRSDGKAWFYRDARQIEEPLFFIKLRPLSLTNILKGTVNLRTDNRFGGYGTLLKRGER